MTDETLVRIDQLDYHPAFEANLESNFAEIQENRIGIATDVIFEQLINRKPGVDEPYVGLLHGTMAGGKTTVVRNVVERLHNMNQNALGTDQHPYRVYKFAYDNRANQDNVDPDIEEDEKPENTEIYVRPNGSDFILEGKNRSNISQIIADVETMTSDDAQTIFITEAAFLFDYDDREPGDGQPDNRVHRLYDLLALTDKKGINVVFDSLGIWFNGEHIPFIKVLLEDPRLTQAFTLQAYDSFTGTMPAEFIMRVVAIDEETGDILHSDNFNEEGNRSINDFAYYENPENPRVARKDARETAEMLKGNSMISQRILVDNEIDGIQTEPVGDLLWLPSDPKDDRVAIGSTRYFQLTEDQFRTIYGAIGVPLSETVFGITKHYANPNGKIVDWDNLAAVA